MAFIRHWPYRSQFTDRNERGAVVSELGDFSDRQKARLAALTVMRDIKANRPSREWFGKTFVVRDETQCVIWEISFSEVNEG
jgi:hypothetical protein